jgi:5-methylcytosine-specific restriction protein A
VRGTAIPLNRVDIAEVFALIKSFAKKNGENRPSVGFLPDHYIQSDIIDNFESRVLKSLKGDRDARLARLENAKRQTKQRHQNVIVFDRNPDVVAECLYLANGKCQRCKKLGPFLKSKDGLRYLEVHHKIRLIDGGTDTLDNVTALCPNCHREMHYGNPSAI